MRQTGSPCGSQSLGIHTLSFAIAALCAHTGCKPRTYNESSVQTTNTPPALSRTAEAQAESLMPVWPVPRSVENVRTLPSVQTLGVSAATWQTLLNDAFSVEEARLNGKPARTMTLSSPDCARAPDAWKISAARLSLYETDLPGNVTSWQTMGLQRETDLAQRVQLHVTVQAWCTSERLDRTDFVHTLDHAFLFTFDLTTPHLSSQLRTWLDDLKLKSSTSETATVVNENKILPYARALSDVHDSRHGRATIVQEWNKALQVDDLLQKSQLPSPAWSSVRQAFVGPQNFTAPYTLTHPTLQATPAALNEFFNRFVSEKNLLRVRAHVTEGLGTAQHFALWERTAGRLSRDLLQTVAGQWDRALGTVTLSPLLADPQKFATVGREQPATGQFKPQLKDIDLESTLLAQDVSTQELISLREKIIDTERTSLQTTRCVSCHGFDDALQAARDGRPVMQRGLSAARLTALGVNTDARPVINMRSLRAAEADAARFEEEKLNVRRATQR